MPGEKKLGSLRLFVCILVGTVLAVFAGVFFTIFHTTMPGMLLETEKSYMSRQLALVEGLLSSARESVAVLAADNAVWEEAHLFANGENPGFIENNWADKPLLESMHLNLVLFVNKQGEVLYSDFECPQSKSGHTFPPEFKAYLVRLSQAVVSRYEADPASAANTGSFGKEGIYLASDAAFSLAIMPIVTVRGAPGASGALVMGRVIDAAYFHKLTRYYSTSFSITHATGQALSQTQAIWIPDSDTVATQSSFIGIDGTPLLLTMKEPRKIYIQGQASLHKALFLMGVALLLFGVLLYQAILRLVLYPTKEAEAALEKRLEQQELMAEMSRGFISSGDKRDLINNALRMAGEFMGISKILLAQLDEDTRRLNAQYEWYTDTESCFRPEKTSWPFTPGSPEYDGFIVQKLPYLVHDDIRDMEGFKLAYEHGIRSLAGVPVYAFGKFWGLLSFNTCNAPRHWTESDVQLVTLIGRVIQGVMERSETEKNIIAAREEAERSSEAKSEFLSRMSHEMRTPLNAIIGMTNIGTSSAELEKKQYCLYKISEASQHLLGVINDILDMSKIAANKFELSYAEFPFTAMVHRIGNVVAFRVEEKNQTYSVDIDPAIPYAIVSDEQRLAQVIANLLSNAVKFTPEKGSISLHAKLEEETPSGCIIRVDVTDTGIGIPEEAQRKLFKSFEQADGGISRKFGGTGLGLAISKRIVEMLDGRIWVESEENNGSRFTFTFKATRGETNAPEISGTQDSSPALPTDCLKTLPCLSDRAILLAEDIEVNREIVLTLLEDTGIEIDCAENGEQACQKFRANPGKYAMIFMDIHMPEVDGYEATRRIRGMNDLPEASTVPIIAMTANVFREDVEKCLEAGMNGHIGKPINLDELIEQLTAYCGR